MDRISKNKPTIEHLQIACRHVREMRDAGVTENHAIRTLELFADVYAKLRNGGSATPHHVGQVPLGQWSIEARKLRDQNPNGKPRDYLRVEHGTPRRAFARKVMELAESGKLNGQTMDELAKRYWKLAVITVAGDDRLNKISRSEALETPDERWRKAGIAFDQIDEPGVGLRNEKAGP